MTEWPDPAHEEWFALASANPAAWVEFFHQRAADARAMGARVDEVAALRALGIAERSRMELRSAIAALEEAATAAGNVRELAEPVCLTLAGTYSYAGRSTEAITMLRDLAASARGEMKTQALAQLIPVLCLAGRFAEALDSSTDLLVVFHHDPVWLARIRHARSMALLYLGKPEAGLAEANEAIDIYARLGNVAGVARCRHNVAALRSLGGDVVGALREFELVDQEFRRLEIPLALDSDGRVATLLAAGLVDDAIAEAESAMRELARQGADGLMVEAAIWLALSLAHAQRWDEVVAPAEKAAEAANRQGRPAWAAFASALAVEGRVGGLYAAASPWISTKPTPPTTPSPEAAERAQRVASELAQHGWAQATRSEVLTALLPDPTTGLPDVEALQRLGGLRSSGLIEHRLLGALASGAAIVIGGGPTAHDDAIAMWQRAVADATALDQVRAFDDHLAVSSVAETLNALIVALLLSDDDHSDALNWIERQRSDVGRVSNSRATEDTDAVSDELLTELRSLRLQATAPSDSHATHSRMARQAEIERALRDRSARPATDHTDAAAVAFATDSARETQQPTLHSPPGSVSLSFVITGDDLHLLVLDETGVISRPAPVPLQAVRAAADRASQQAQRATQRIVRGRTDLAAATAASAELDDLLLGTTRTRLVGRHVRVSAPSELDLAWSGLPSLAAVPVTVVASLFESGGPTRASLRPRTSADLVGIAGPDLAYADEEVLQIVALQGGAAHTGAAATRATVTDALRHAEIVHLACHAHLRSDQPLFSSLELADGPLFLHELRMLRRPPVHSPLARLVVLSACDAGRHVHRRGSGAGGFANALRGIGIATVIAPHSPVPDRTSVAAMVALHDALTSGVPPADALAGVRNSAELDDATRFTAARYSVFGS